MKSSELLTQQQKFDVLGFSHGVLLGVPLVSGTELSSVTVFVQPKQKSEQIPTAAGQTVILKGARRRKWEGQTQICLMTFDVTELVRTGALAGPGKNTAP